jgi:hypothetical protein
VPNGSDHELGRSFAAFFRHGLNNLKHSDDKFGERVSSPSQATTLLDSEEKISSKEEQIRRHASNVVILPLANSLADEPIS